MSNEEVQQLVHELQVHQVELEMQNGNLRRTQLELELAKDRYAELYDFAPVGFLTLDENGAVLEINLTACQLLGKSRKGMVGKQFESFLFPPDQVRFREYLRRTIQTKDKQISEIVRLPHDHTPYLIRLEGSSDDIPSGLPVSRIRMAMIDLTAEERAKQARKEQELWFGGVLQTAMDAIITIDEHQHIVLFNAAAEKMFGCSSKTVIGKSIDRFIPRRFRKVHREHVQQFQVSKETSRAMGTLGTLFALRADGTEFPIEASISQFQGKDTKKSMTVILRDITERKQFETVLEESLSLQQSLAQTNAAILNALPVHVAMVDHRGNILSVNEPWKRFATANVFKGTNFGIGMNYLRVCAKAYGECAEVAKKVAKGLREILSGKREIFVWEYPCHAPSEPRWFRVTVTPFAEKNQIGAVIMHLNITKRRLAEDASFERERTLAVLMQNLPGMAYRCRNDRDWTMEFVSQGAKALTGYQPSDLMDNHNVSFGQDVIYPDDRRAVWKTVQTAIRKNHPYQCTYRIQTADGTVKWVWEQGQRIQPDVGKVVTLEGFITDITKQKLAEEGVKDSQERLDLALFGARLGVWDWNIQTNEIIYTERWAKMIGYAKKEIEPTIQAWQGLMHPEDKPRVMKILQAHLDGHTPFFQTEYRLRTKAGKWKWVLDTGKVVSRDAKGAPLRATGIHQDIHERKDMEHALLEERQFTDAVVNTAGALVCVLDNKGNVVRFNRACEQLTGYAADEVLGRNFWDFRFVPAGQVAEVKKVFRSLCAGQFPNYFENHWITKDGSERLISWANTALVDDRGQVAYVIGTGVDITDRQRMEEALRESQERFQAFMDHTPAAAFLKDLDGRYVYVNKFFEKQFGYGLADCLGKTDAQLFPPETAQVFRMSHDHALPSGQVVESEETTLDSRGRRREWLVFKFPITDGGTQHLIGGVGLDITVRKRAEQALREREQQLQQSRHTLRRFGKRLVTAQEEERKRISRELHDDMNQRLAAMALTIQFTQQRLEKSDPLHNTLQRLYDEVSTISDDIRRLAYQLHPTVVDDLGLKVALQSFVRDFQSWARVSASFQARDVPDAIPQEIASCVFRVTQEALSNVAKHANASSVTVALRGEHEAVYLSITDDGKGFEYEGVRGGKRGLGLIGMQERMSYVNGTVTIHSELGKGTDIVIRVPVPPGDA